MVLLALVVLAVLLWLLALTLLRRRPAAAWALLVASALWLALDQPVEGPVLAVLGYVHGLTLADLLSFVGAVTAVVVLVRHAWADSPRRDRAWNVVTVLGGAWTVLALGALLAVTAG